MNRLFTSIQILLILALCLSGCSTPSAEPVSVSCPQVKIGVIIAENSELGKEQKMGYEVAANEINQQAQEQKSCPVKLVYKNETADPSSTQNAMRELITEDRVVAVVGGTTSGSTKRSAALANYLQIPFVVSTDTGDDVTETGTQWLFRIPPTNEAYALAALGLTKSISLVLEPVLPELVPIAPTLVLTPVAAAPNVTLTPTATLPPTPTPAPPVRVSLRKVSIVYEHSEYGESAAVVAGNLALQQGLTLEVYQGFFPNQIDFNSILNPTAIPVSVQGGDLSATPTTPVVTGRSSNYHEVVYLISSDPVQAEQLYQAVKSQAVLVIGIGPGFTSHSFLFDNTGRLKTTGREKLVIGMSWNRDVSFSGVDISPVESGLQDYQKLNNLAKLPLSTQVIEAYTTLKVVMDAVNATLERNPTWKADLASPGINLTPFCDLLAKTLRSPQAPGWDTLMGPIMFDTEGQNAQPTLLVQIINGQLTTVYPDAYKKSSVVYQNDR